MATLGDTLRDARLKKKASLSEAAAATRIKMQTLEALESDNYSSIPAPVYGKGFVRMYAEYLDLDPRKCVEMYAAQAGGTRTAIPKEVVAAQITTLDEPKQKPASAPAAPAAQTAKTEPEPEPLLKLEPEHEPGPEPEPESKPAPEPEKPAPRSAPVLEAVPGAAGRGSLVDRIWATIMAEPLKALIAGLGIVVIAVFVVSGIGRCVPDARHHARQNGAAGGEVQQTPFEPPDPYLEVAP